MGNATTPWLPGQHWALLTLRDTHGLPWEEIAAELRKSVQQVQCMYYSLHSQGRKRLTRPRDVDDR